MTDAFPVSSDDGTSLDETSDRFRGERIGAREFASGFALRLQFFLQHLHALHHIETGHDIETVTLDVGH